MILGLTKKVNFLVALLVGFSVATAMASGSGSELLIAPKLSADQSALQNGARGFMQQCASCHSLALFRYSDFAKLGFSEADVAGFAMGKPLIHTVKSMIPAEAGKQSFGVAPPDLSLVTRARSSAAGSGADWVYTYLNAYYEDKASVTGANNLVFPNTAMPNVLAGMQGKQVLDSSRSGLHGLKLVEEGAKQPEEYRRMVAEMVAFLGYVADPTAAERSALGWKVLLGLLAFLVLAFFLKKNYWKDVV